MKLTRPLTRSLLVAGKTLTETFRDPILLVLLLVLPVFFMFITYIGYGHTPKTATYGILLLQKTDQARGLLEVLEKTSYADGRLQFSFILVESREDAEEDLKNNRAALLLVLEEDAEGRLHYTIRGDAMNLNFIKASVQMESIILPLLERQQGKPQRIALRGASLTTPRPISEFEAYVPGMMVFAILMNIPQTAMLLGKERRKGTLNRLNTSLLQPVDLLGGISLAQMLIAVVQVMLMLGTAMALGFQIRGSLLLAAGICCALAFGSVGMGLLLGCFMSTDTDALNTGSTVSMLQVMLSGSFFAMPGPLLFTWMAHPISAYDFIPATHGMIVLQQVLSGGAGLEQVWFRSAAVLVLSVVYFFIGVAVFRRASK